MVGGVLFIAYTVDNKLTAIAISLYLCYEVTFVKS